MTLSEKSCAFSLNIDNVIEIMICKWYTFCIPVILVSCFMISKYRFHPEQHECESGYFYLKGMNTCHPWLNCSDINEIEVKELIGLGAVKAVYHGIWRNFSVAYSVLNNENYSDDFHNGLEMLKIFSPNPNIVQLIGFCERQNVIVTEYHRLGNAMNISQILSKKYNNSSMSSLKFCLNYALILELLHHGPAGTRVMCDSNDLLKLLSQLLVTDEMRLILNDLDALPEVNKEQNYSVKCGNKALYGTFVAPEQRWNYNKEFSYEEMPGYDEKSDIWKAASVCDHFIGQGIGSDIVRYKLFFIHKSCKNVNAKYRDRRAHV